MNRREKGKLVLVVEDSPTQSIHMMRLMEAHGLRCSLATNGKTGLYLAESCCPDVIILDLEMPHMNGFEMCRRLKAHPGTAEIPVILMTRHDESESVMHGFSLGAVEFIPKDTFAEVVLIETLKQMNVIASG